MGHGRLVGQAVIQDDQLIAAVFPGVAVILLEVAPIEFKDPVLYDLNFAAISCILAFIFVFLSYFFAN